MENEPDIPQPGRDDRLLPLTRAVAWLVIPFLLAAFVILYVDGRHTADWFAWEIGSRLTTALMGAGYLGGAYFFLRVALGRQWRAVHAGFLPVVAFTVAMLLATLVHWEAFLTGNWPFWVWLALYVLAPPLVALAWWRNRRTDPGLQAGDRLVPSWLRAAMGVAGGVLLVLALIAFALPELLISRWPWTLSLLTSRIMAGWHAVLGVGALALATDSRWRAWPIPLQSIVLWQVLMLLALFLHREELGAAGMANWYTVFVIAGLLGLTAVVLLMHPWQTDHA